MALKERYFWAAIGLITISWIVNSLYAHSKQLEEPIFLDHYLETTMGEHDYITFYYLVNKNDRSRISYIKIGDFEGYPQNNFFYEDDSIHNVDTYTHQALRSVTVQLHDFSNENREGRRFNEMKAYFTDGIKSKEITATIGELIIHPAGYFAADARVLQGSSSGGSSDGSSWDSFQATEPLAIEKISFPFTKPIENQFNFTISGKQTERSLDSLEFPIHVEKDKYVTMRTNLKENNFTNPFQFAIRISGTTAQGRSFTNYAHYSLFPYLTQDDVNRIIKEKTGRASDE